MRLTITILNTENLEARHFTQAVWGKTTKIGCTKAYCNDTKGYYYVCNYYPPGNERSAYVQSTECAKYNL